MSTANKPTHRAYAVRKNGDKSRWIEIGALWAHQDGKGFNLKLNLMPVDGTDIAIRKIEPKDDAEIAWDEPAQEGGAK